jgi:hypothetical protein
VKKCCGRNGSSSPSPAPTAARLMLPCNRTGSRGYGTGRECQKSPSTSASELAMHCRNRRTHPGERRAELLGRHRSGVAEAEVLECATAELAML